MDWFLYDNGLRHEKVKGFESFLIFHRLIIMDLLIPQIC